MPTNGTPPPIRQPIEPTQYYLVSYYNNNGDTTLPQLVDMTLYTYNQAVERGKQLIADNGNEGVAILSQLGCAVIYPAVPWEDF
jgi:hypothetical protein